MLKDTCLMASSFQEMVCRDKLLFKPLFKNSTLVVSGSVQPDKQFAPFQFFLSYVEAALISLHQPGNLPASGAVVLQLVQALAQEWGWELQLERR